MTLPTPSGWQACPSGELTSLGERLRRRRSRRYFLRTISATSLIAVTGGAVAVWLARDTLAYRLLPDATYGGIGCTEVRTWATAYGKGQVAAELSIRIREHLSKCARCARFYESLGLS